MSQNLDEAVNESLRNSDQCGMDETRSIDVQERGTMRESEEGGAQPEAGFLSRDRR